MSLEAVILAGGLGTRIRSVSGDLPKVMLPVAGRPFLEHVLTALSARGFGRVILAVGYRRDRIRAHFGTVFAGIDLIYSEEFEPRGTGGATRQALQMAETGDVFVLNGDTFAELDYGAMMDRHKSLSAQVPMAVAAVADLARFGAVEIEDDRVIAFREKGLTGPGLINAGVYVLRRDLLDGFAADRHFSLENDVLVPDVARLHPVAWRMSGRFIDIGVPADFEAASALLAAGPLAIP